MSRRLNLGCLTAGLAMVAVGLSPAASRAQGAASVDITIRAARPDTVKVEAGAGFTAVFAVRNPGSDSAQVAPRLELPRGWRAVAGITSFTLPPHASDTWLTGISVPASAAATTYVVRGGVGSASDSVVIRVVERRGVDVVSLDAPSWVLAGDGLQARFLVRNSGNVATTFDLTPTAGRALQVAADRRSLELAAGASGVVSVRTTMVAAATRTSDDVIELIAVDRADSTIRMRAAARTTVVPRNAGGGDYAELPAMAAFRTGGGAAGVSPIVLAGAGVLADRRTAVDFFAQAPTDQHSPFGFGERDEYRASISRGRDTLRVGDQIYGASSLTTTGVMGFGAEAISGFGPVSAGAFAQRLRWTPGTPTEEGAFATLSSDSAHRVSANVLFRESGATTIGMTGASAATVIPSLGVVEVEGSASDSAGRRGAALRARVGGERDGIRYDVGTTRGSDEFAGPVRGMTAGNASISTHLTRDIDLSATASLHGWSNVVASVGRMGQRFSTATLTATWQGTTSVEYGWLARRDDGALTPVDGVQRGLRVSALRQYGFVGINASIERGEVVDASHNGATPYAVGSLGIRTALGSLGSVGVSATRSAGHTLTGANGELLGAGANAQLFLPGRVQFGFSMTAQRATFGVLDSSGAWFSVTDARLERRFENGAIVGLHARMLQTPATFGSPNSSTVYLEVRSPFHLPAGHSRETGRAVGRVMDAEHGTPVAGVLVRVGDQAAVSDRDGRVRFAGLDSGVHHVSVEPSAATAGAILVGDVALDMRQVAQAPALFAVGVTRGAHVAAHVVRSVGLALAEPAGGPSASPEETAPMAGMLVALEGERDTLYQVTDGRGMADFGTVAPGTWTLAVRQAQPEAWMEFERTRLTVTIGAGERRDVDFRLMPVQRQVRMLNGGGELRARTLPDKPREPDRP